MTRGKRDTPIRAPLGHAPAPGQAPGLNPGSEPAGEAARLEAYGTNFATLSPADFAEVVRLAAPRLHALLRSHYSGALNPTDLREAVAQAVSQAWIRRGTFDPARGSLWGWLWTIASHAAIDRLRERSRQPSVLAPRAVETHRASPASIGPGDGEKEEIPGEDPAAVNRRMRLARLFLDSLSARDRRIVEGAMSDQRGWTRDIADELATTPGAVRIRWLRLRRDLVERFERDGT